MKCLSWRMELRQLKYFAKAAELQNFTEAAAALFITQSTLSQQIKQLEDELQLPLFDRIAKRVRLTEAGKSFLPYALKTLKDSEDGRDILRDLMNLKTGTLSVGVTYGLSNLLTKAVGEFNKSHPQIKLMISFGTTQELLGNLETGNLDFMLSFYDEPDNERIITDHLFFAQLSLIAHSNHPVTAKKNITLQDLPGLPLILPSPGYSIRSYLNLLMKKNDLSPSLSIEVNDIHTLLHFVQTSRWVTVLMNSTIRHHPELKALPIIGADMQRQATIAWPKNVYRKKSASSLAELLLMHSADYQTA